MEFKLDQVYRNIQKGWFWRENETAKKTSDRFQKLDNLALIRFEENKWHLLTAWS